MIVRLATNIEQGTRNNEQGKWNKEQGTKDQAQARWRGWPKAVGMFLYAFYMFFYCISSPINRYYGIYCAVRRKSFESNIIFSN